MPFPWRRMTTPEPEKALVDDVSDDDNNDNGDEHPFVELAPRSPKSISSASSSRTTSNSRQPMLPAPRSSRLGRFSRYRFRHRPLDRTSLFLCLAFISILSIIFVTLVRMSFVSTRRLETMARLAFQPEYHTFPFLKRYYGGVRSLVARPGDSPEYPADTHDGVPLHDNSTTTMSPLEGHGIPILSNVFDPYPDYQSAEYLSEYHAVADCMALAANTSLGHRIPAIRSYAGLPKGYPEPVMGSYKVLGLRDDVCFDRFGRLGPYGYGYEMNKGGTGAGLRGDREGVEAVWAEQGQPDFREVRWGKLQQQCLQANAHRFREQEEPAKRCLVPGCERSGLDVPAAESAVAEDAGTVGSQASSASASNSSSETSNKKRLPRTAFILRTWTGFTYTTETILFLRSLVSELSLLSGGEYTVHLLVHVKDNNLQIWADDDVYRQALREAVPEEFWDMATLWTERQMELIYGGLEESWFHNLPVFGVYRALFMPLQWFARQHPEYEYFWHWEMDARYTGHYYHFLDRLSRWARDQPRKGLWERNARYYIPWAHGSWDNFREMVRDQTEPDARHSDLASGVGGASPRGRARAGDPREKPIWGPRKPLGDEAVDEEWDVVPPSATPEPADDDYAWGVGEEADLITFGPLFDPVGTEWSLRDDVTGYNRTGDNPPRRTCINTTSRLSRRLLRTMHRENALGRRSLFTETWPASVALHHGLKAVAAPHPIFIDREWPVDAVARTFNGGRNGATGGSPASVFGPREHNFLGVTWYFATGFGPNLYRRWLGLRVDNAGGDDVERAQEGRMCIPPTLLHPIKEVGLPVEGE